MASGIFVPELRSLGKKIERKVYQTTSANSRIVIGINYRMLTEKALKDHNLPDLQGGVEITSVNRSSPAADSGLQVGDVIRKVNGTILKSINDLRDRVNSARIGQPLQFEVWHDGQPLDTTVTPVNGFDFYGDSCDKGEAEGCLSLGDLYAELKHPLDDQQAFEVYKKSCSMGLAEACYRVSLAYRDGRGVDKDSARAIALLEESCEGKYFDACSGLGYSYQTGTGAEKDIIKASGLYKKACDGGSLLGCSNLGSLFTEGIGVEKDPAQAAKLFDRACDGGLALGCRLLGELYREGTGVPKDPARAAKLYTQACSDGEVAGCGNLAALLEEGDDGVPKDIGQAKILYDKACGEGQGWSCSKLGWLFSQDGPDKNFSQALSFYQRGCKLEESTACNNQGSMYEHGQGVEVDKVKASSLYEEACDGDALACDNRGRLAAEVGDTAKALTFYGKACEQSLGQGCFDLAAVITETTNKEATNKEGIDLVAREKNLNAALLKSREALRRALESFKKECDSGNELSCFSLAFFYEHGVGGLLGQDLGKAATFYEAACRSGNLKQACNKIGH